MAAGTDAKFSPSTGPARGRYTGGVTSNDPFDVLVIGCGQAAMPLVPKLVEAGLRVGLCERTHLGGSCVNFGCTPTKAALAPAHAAAVTRRGTISPLLSDSAVDFAGLMDRARQIRDQANGNVNRKFQKLADEKGDRFELIRGHARLAGRDGERFVVECDGRTLTAEKVILETGTRTLRPPIDGLGDLGEGPHGRLMTAGNWIERRGHPGRMVIAGGGYIGLEGSQLYKIAAPDKSVLVVEKGDRVAKKEDEDVSRELQRLLEADGVAFRLNRKVSAVREEGGELKVTLEAEDGQAEEVAADTLYLTPGRVPNTDDLGLETVACPTDEKGNLDVDDLYQTSVKGLYAVGDITGGKMFTHSAQYANKVLADLFTGEGQMRRPDDDLIPYAMFTDPPLGRCGITQTQADERGLDAVSITFPAGNNDRHHQSGHDEGLIKLTGDRGTGRLLGAAFLCERGPDLATQLQIVLWQGGDLDLITKTMFIHPTFSEATLSACHKLQRGLTS